MDEFAGCLRHCFFVCFIILDWKLWFSDRLVDVDWWQAIVLRVAVVKGVWFLKWCVFIWNGVVADVELFWCCWLLLFLRCCW